MATSESAPEGREVIETSEELIRTDIGKYLELHERKDQLRFLTAGSVDDGKSTLIGRLLYDTKMIYEDQLAAVKQATAVHGTTGTDFDPALLTDGLKAEREQGITIDVAYRYFSTDRRSFIIADTPGHEQYTRNMATGASSCDLAIILIDARHGVVAQTKRHSFIASLLGIRHFVVAVNKMDLVDYSETTYRQIRRDYEGFADKLETGDVHFIPMSALNGDNVVNRSENMTWFQGAPLLSYLENVHVGSDRNLIDFRFPVQYVMRPDLNFRGFCGTVASGIVRPGDEVMSLPSRQRSTIKRLVTMDGDLQEAFAPLAVTIELEDEIDASRGDMFVHPKNLPHVSEELEAMLVWMGDDPLVEGKTYQIKSGANVVPGVVSKVAYSYDINTLKRADASELGPNDIGRVAVTLHRPLAFDSYSRNQRTGAFIIVDRLTNTTVATGMVVERSRRGDVVHSSASTAPMSANIRREGFVSRDERATHMGHCAATLWITGLSGSGKSTIARAVERALLARGVAAIALDGDNVRHGLSRDLAFSAGDRAEHMRRIAEVARLMNDAGLVVITSLISPCEADRANAREIIGEDAFVELYVDTSLEVCEGRDAKGLYAKARAGEIQDFTGISAPYAVPEDPALVLSCCDGSSEDFVTALAADVERVVEILVSKGVVNA